MLSTKIYARIEKLDKTLLEAITLMGSYARGDQGVYSDIDIVCFLKKDVEEQPLIIELVDQQYVVICFITHTEVENWFTIPKKASSYIEGLRSARTIWSSSDYFAELQQKAIDFRWNNSLQQKANFYVSKELVSWLEEVHKALQGLLNGDIGRMLNGLHGLTFGLFNLLAVQQGILLLGDNSFFDQVIEHFKNNSEFVSLGKTAFGVGGAFELSDRVIAGLKLFCLVIDLLDNILLAKDKEAIRLVTDQIKKELRMKGILSQTEI